MARAEGLGLLLWLRGPVGAAWAEGRHSLWRSEGVAITWQLAFRREDAEVKASPEAT